LKEVAKSNENYYEARKNDISLRIKAAGSFSVHYVIELSGADLLKLGILK
jgi:hypothetical protein